MEKDTQYRKLTFRLKFRSNERTLTHSEINEQMKVLVKALQEQFPEIIVDGYDL